MDFRRMRLISWKAGYDLHEQVKPERSSRPYGVIVARRVRKQERAALARELDSADDTFDEVFEARGYERYRWTPFYEEQRAC